MEKFHINPSNDKKSKKKTIKKYKNKDIFSGKIKNKNKVISIVVKEKNNDNEFNYL